MPVANFFPSPSSRSARACPLARPPARPPARHHRFPSCSAFSSLLLFWLRTRPHKFPFLSPFFQPFFFPFLCFWPPFFFFLRRRRIRAAGELLRFLFPFRFVRADSTTSAHCASDGFFLVSVVIWGVFAVGLEKVKP